MLELTENAVLAPRLLSEVAAVVAPVTAGPDPILFWNAIALEANRVSHTAFATTGVDEHTGPTSSSRALAMVHLAMYDACAGVVNDEMRLPRYITTPAAPGAGATLEAAVAAAAHTMLSRLFPSQRLFFDLKLTEVDDLSNPGYDFGVAVAETLLTDRANDPPASNPGYRPSLQRGKHRPDPDHPGQGFHGANYGAQSKGFAIQTRFDLAPPPFDNAEYRDALREVRGKGIAPELMGTLPETIAGRTAEETLIGIFWAYDGVAEIGTPPRLYNQIVRKVAIARNNTVEDNARLFAFVNVAMADAAILAWDEKYKHDLWRPVIGIREHDQSMGPVASVADNAISDDCDAQWLPLGAPRSNRPGKNFTPPFPAYPSGHATFGAAAFHITRLFYGEGGRFSNQSLAPDTLFDGLFFVSDEFNGLNADNKSVVRPRHRRNFPDGLWQMIEENGRSRVYLGVHWIFDAFAVDADNNPDIYRRDKNKYIGGVPLGLQIAENIFDSVGGLGPKKSMV